MVIADADGRIVHWNDAAERSSAMRPRRPWASRSTSSFREPSLQLAGEDSNLQPPDPKSGVLPLNYPPGCPPPTLSGRSGGPPRVGPSLRDRRRRVSPGQRDRRRGQAPNGEVLFVLVLAHAASSGRGRAPHSPQWTSASLTQWCGPPIRHCSAKRWSTLSRAVFSIRTMVIGGIGFLSRSRLTDGGTCGTPGHDANPMQGAGARIERSGARRAATTTSSPPIVTAARRGWIVILRRRPPAHRLLHRRRTRDEDPRPGHGPQPAGKWTT